MFYVTFYISHLFTTISEDILAISGFKEGMEDRDYWELDC